MSPILIVNYGIVSPTLNVNSTLFVIAWIFLGDLQCYNYYHLPSDFHPNFNHPWQYFITSCWQEKVRFWQWMHSSTIHDNICKFIHKKCHPKSYHSDIKYHMTLNMIFSVATFIFSKPGSPTNLLSITKDRVLDHHWFFWVFNQS